VLQNHTGHHRFYELQQVAYRCKNQQLQTEKGYCFEITADRFLRNMVRSLVGTLLESGVGRLDSKGFQDIVNAKDRSRAGQSAPAQGLFLVDIGYEGYSFEICR